MLVCISRISFGDTILIYSSCYWHCGKALFEISFYLLPTISVLIFSLIRKVISCKIIQKYWWILQMEQTDMDVIQLFYQNKQFKTYHCVAYRTGSVIFWSSHMVHFYMA